jgi:hypothetical protein
LTTDETPEEVWCAGGSGTLARGLAKAWPRVRLNVVQGGGLLRGNHPFRGGSLCCLDGGVFTLLRDGIITLLLHGSLLCGAAFGGCSSMRRGVRRLLAAL